MDDDQFRPALHDEVLAYTEVLSRADLEAPVPSCPGWTVYRLTDHLGRVHRSVSQMMADPTPEGGRWAKLPHAPEGPEVRGWFAEGAAQLEADLATFDAANAVDATADAEETLIPTWAGRQPPRFWARRMAHETAVHRWDAESAGPAGLDATPLDRTLAATASTSSSRCSPACAWEPTPSGRSVPSRSGWSPPTSRARGWSTPTAPR